MAVDIRDNGTVGCCYYVAREEKIYLFSDAHVADMTIIETSLYCSAFSLMHLLTCFCFQSKTRGETDRFAG